MRSDLTDITLVVDRSGSMQEIRFDAEGGVIAFIVNQAKEPGPPLRSGACHTSSQWKSIVARMRIGSRFNETASTTMRQNSVVLPKPAPARITSNVAIVQFF